MVTINPPAPPKTRAQALAAIALRYPDTTPQPKELIPHQELITHQAPHQLTLFGQPKTGETHAIIT